MNIYLEKVKEFMLTFGQPVLDKPTPLPEDRQELRIALIFEELKEYAEASGKLDYFDKLCDQFSTEFFTYYKEREIEYVPIIDQVEQLDALEDMQYVLSGAVHEHGFGNIFDAGFDEVHDSNMSKADDNLDDAIITEENYQKQGILTYWNMRERLGWLPKFITYKKDGDKVLKSYKYKPAQLKDILYENKEHTS